MTNIATVKPTPMPMPSRKETTTPFFDAMDSARAKMIAKTTTKSR